MKQSQPEHSPRAVVVAILLALIAALSLSCEDTPSGPEDCLEPRPSASYLTGQYTWTRRLLSKDTVLFQYSLFRFSDDFSPVLKFLMQEDTTRNPIIHIFNSITSTYSFSNDSLTLGTPTIHPDGHSSNVPQGRFSFNCQGDSLLFIAKPDTLTTMRLTMLAP